jgi:hypothetical protein
LFELPAIIQTNYENEINAHMLISEQLRTTALEAEVKNGVLI